MAMSEQSKAIQASMAPKGTNVEYIVTRTAPDEFKIAKTVDQGQRVLATYTLLEYPRPRGIHKYGCDCPAGIFHRGVRCRHQDMIDRFKEAGEPFPYMEEQPQ